MSSSGSLLLSAVSLLSHSKVPDGRPELAQYISGQFRISSPLGLFSAHYTRLFICITRCTATGGWDLHLGLGVCEVSAIFYQERGL